MVQEKLIARGQRTELAHFKRIYGTRTDEELLRILGRSMEEVRRLDGEHGLSKDKAFVRRSRGAPATRMPRWSTAELLTLRNNYSNQPNLEIARSLRRSVKSVVSKAHALGFKKALDHVREMGRANVSVRWK